MSKLSYIITDSGITAVIDGETMTITSDNPSYGQVLDAIRIGEDHAVIADLFRAANAIKRYMQGAIEIDEAAGEITYNGETIHNVVVDRILDFMSRRLPVGPLVKFLENLMANPSFRSREQLYTFLEYKKLPITDDGCFLAYKGVTNDYLDCHTRTFSNRVGVINKMERSKVDDDSNRGCSYGFHVGSLDYAKSFGSTVVVVKVNPKDVVSVPTDCSCQKCRVAEYEVTDDFNGEIEASLVGAAGTYDSISDTIGDLW